MDSPMAEITERFATLEIPDRLRATHLSESCMPPITVSCSTSDWPGPMEPTAL
jgi:hypothetical protein